MSLTINTNYIWEIVNLSRKGATYQIDWWESRDENAFQEVFIKNRDKNQPNNHQNYTNEISSNNKIESLAFLLMKFVLFS